jgi:hypothetical protein
VVRRASATSAIRRAASWGSLRCLVSYSYQPPRAVSCASARTAARATVSRRCRRTVPAAARRSASRASSAAVRKARSGTVSAGSPGWSGNSSSARARRVPRYRAPGSRSCSSQVRAASASMRWWRSRSRSSSIQPCSRGQPVMSASCASWTPSSSAVSRRARVSRSTTTGTSGSAQSASSSRLSGRRVSGMPWPGTIIRSSRCRAAHACPTDRPP